MTDSTLVTTYPNTTTLPEPDTCLEIYKDKHLGEECEAACSVVLGRAMCFDGAYGLNALGAVACVLMAALAAGLTMGLLSLDANQLRLTMEIRARDCTSIDEEKELMKEKRLATKLYPLVRRHHWLLVTLLLLNTCANEALPIFMDEVVPTTWIAILISVTFVLMFGEVVPSALFTGPNQMSIAATLTPLVWFFMVLFFPIAYPVAKLLDLCLNEHSGRYQLKVPELKSLIRAQVKNREHGHSGVDEGKLGEFEKNTLEKSGFSKDEVDLMLGALEIKYVNAEKVMTPLDKTFMLGKKDVLDNETMAAIIASGHSRVPVYDGSKHNVRGMLIVKRLIVVDPEESRSVSTFGLHKPLCVGLNENLLQILNKFQKGVHLAIVTNKPDAVRQAWKENRPVPPNVHMAGILTFEDVMERLMKDDIEDESDIGVLPMFKRMEQTKDRVSRIKLLAEAMIKQSRKTPKMKFSKLVTTAGKNTRAQNFAAVDTKTEEQNNEEPTQLSISDEKETESCDDVSTMKEPLLSNQV